MSKGTRGALSSATASADSSESSLVSNLNQRAVEMSTNVASALSNGDTTAGFTGNKLVQASGAITDANSDLGVLGSSLDTLLAGDGQQQIKALKLANGTVNSVIIGSLTGAQSVASTIDSSSSEAESQTSIEAGKVVSAASAAFNNRANLIVNQASSYGDAIAKSDQASQASQGIFSDSFTDVENALWKSQAVISDVNSQGETFSGVKDVKELITDALSSIERNVTSLSSSVNRIALNVSSGVGLPDSFIKALTDIVDDALRNAELSRQQGALSVQGLQAANSNASTNSLSVLNDMQSASDQWQAGYSNATQTAVGLSRSRVEEMSNVADQAGGIANLLSTIQGNREKISSSAGQMSEMTNAELEQTLQQLTGSVQASRGSLTRASASGSAQADFGSKVNNGIASQFLQALQQEATMASSTSADSGSAMQETGGRAAMDIGRMETNLASDQQTRQAKIASVLGNVSSMDSEFAKNISGNKDAVAIQLLMSKRAVRNILNSWSGYSDYETSKFKKMSATDQEHVAMTERLIDNSKAESSDKLLGSMNEMDSLSSDLQQLIGNYLDFTNSTVGQLGTLSRAAPLLNTSTAGSIGQLSETAFEFDRRDGELDVEARNETLTALEDFEASLDEHASMAIAAANGNLLPALAGG